MNGRKLSLKKLLLLLPAAPALLPCTGYGTVSGSAVFTPSEKCFSSDSLKRSLSDCAPYGPETEQAAAHRVVRIILKFSIFKFTLSYGRALSFQKCRHNGCLSGRLAPAVTGGPIGVVSF